MSTSVGCPLVLVEWDDSRRPAPEWVWLREFAPAAPCKCASVGWLIHDGEDSKALAPNTANLNDGDDDAQACGVIHIPARCITRIVRLAETG